MRVKPAARDNNAQPFSDWAFPVTYKPLAGVEELLIAEERGFGFCPGHCKARTLHSRTLALTVELDEQNLVSHHAFHAPLNQASCRL